MTLALAACAPEGGRQTTATAVTITGATTIADDGTTTAATAEATSDTTSSGATSSATTRGTASTPTSTNSSGTSTDATAGPGTSTGEPGTTAATGSTTAANPVCPPPGELDCSPGPGSGEGDTCSKGEPCFRTTVQDAVKQVLAEHPAWFMHDEMGEFVLEVELYMGTVVLQVAAAGLCAIRDPNAGDEIAVKFNNDYAESFDILTAANYARSGDGIYTATCAPAWF